MKASDLMVKALENEGVEKIFGVPGEENLDFLESLNHSKIQFIPTRHEQAAGFMAATVGRLTGKPGVCLSTLGPGATNFMTSVAYSYLCGFPCLFLTGQKPIKSSKQAQFQLVDIVQMMRPITKFSTQIINGNHIPSLIREAFQLAVAEKPGPIHLELPEDIAAENVNRNPFTIHNHSYPAANQECIDQVAHRISKAKKPLIVVASGCARGNTQSYLKKFIDETGIYFLTTQMGKGIIDERHPLCLGTAALSSDDFIHEAIQESDLILTIGHDLTEKPPFFMKEDGVEVAHIGYYPAKIDDLYFPQHQVIGCLNANLNALLNSIQEKPKTNDSFKKTKEKITKHVYEKTCESKLPLSITYIIQEMRAALGSSDIISLDNGLYKVWFARNFVAHEENDVLLDNSLATMGAGLPVAIASKLIHPNRDVFALCGDGGFMMNAQEVETAVRLNLDLTIILLKDDSYGMIKWKQKTDGFSDYGLDFGPIDFIQHVQSFGGKGYTVKSPEDFSNLITQCKKEKGVKLIEVPMEYESSTFSKN